MAGGVRTVFRGGAAVLAGVSLSQAAFAEPVRSDQAALAQVAEVAVLQLCMSYVTGADAPPEAFAPDLAQDVYDLQPGAFELGRFGRITTATGELRIAVFAQERVCRVGVGDAPVEAVKEQLLAAMGAPGSGWRETDAEDKNGAWTLSFVSDVDAKPVQLAINGFSGPRDGGRGRQLWVTVGQTPVE
jgi:hypothetical protein